MASLSAPPTLPQASPPAVAGAARRMRAAAQVRMRGRTAAAALDGGCGADGMEQHHGDGQRSPVKEKPVMSNIGNSTNILWHNCPIGQSNRQKLLGQKGCVVWITGLSGSAAVVEHYQRQIADLTGFVKSKFPDEQELPLSLFAAPPLPVPPPVHAPAQSAGFRTRLQVLALHRVFLHSTRPTPRNRTRGLHRRRPTRHGRGRKCSGGLARPTGTTTRRRGQGAQPQPQPQSGWCVLEQGGDAGTSGDGAGTPGDGATS